MTTIIANATPCWRVTAEVVDIIIEIHVDPIIAWAVNDYVEVPLIPICVSAGEVRMNMKRPHSYLVAELSEYELEAAVEDVVIDGYVNERVAAESAGLRWRIDDTNYSLTGFSSRSNNAPVMTRAQDFAFDKSSGGTWAVADGVDASEVAHHADNLDTYVETRRAKNLREAVKFVPVSVAELVAAPTTEPVVTRSAEAG